MPWPFDGSIVPVLSDQVPGERLGQALTGLAVAGGLGGDRGELLIVAELLEPIDGLIARLVRGEDLGEEDAQGDPRSVDSIAPAMVADDGKPPRPWSWRGA